MIDTNLGCLFDPSLNLMPKPYKCVLEYVLASPCCVVFYCLCSNVQPVAAKERVPIQELLPGFSVKCATYGTIAYVSTYLSIKLKVTLFSIYVVARDVRHYNPQFRFACANALVSAYVRASNY